MLSCIDLSGESALFQKRLCTHRGLDSFLAGIINNRELSLHRAARKLEYYNSQPVREHGDLCGTGSKSCVSDQCSVYQDATRARRPRARTRDIQQVLGTEDTPKPSPRLTTGNLCKSPLASQDLDAFSQTAHTIFPLPFNSSPLFGNTA